MFLRLLDPVQRCPVSLPFSLPGLCPVEPESTSIVIFLGAQGFSDLFTSDSKISKMQRMPIDPLTYEHLVCAESGDTISFAFPGLSEPHVCDKKALRLFNLSEKIQYCRSK